MFAVDSRLPDLKPLQKLALAARAGHFRERAAERVEGVGIAAG